MPKFNVSFETTIVVVGQIEVSAKDDDAAQWKVQEMIDDGKLGINWEPKKEAEKTGAEFEESENSTEIEECSEV